MAGGEVPAISSTQSGGCSAGVSHQRKGFGFQLCYPYCTVRLEALPAGVIEIGCEHNVELMFVAQPNLGMGAGFKGT